MGCCNGSVLVFVICAIQLVSILGRLVMDFLGFLYLSILPGFVQIIVVIIAIFGLCLYKHKLLIVYLVWNIIFIAWNIFVICLYLGVGTLTEKSHTVLGFGASSSWWVNLTKECKETNSCAVTGNVVEVIVAGIQILLSIMGCVASAFVIYLLREKDDTNPVFQVYKAPSSRRSSISLRMDREASLTRPEHWELSGQGRDSIRSNRSTRSVRTNNISHNGTRQSKRSNRGSTRSKKSSSGRSGQNGSAKNSRPNALPWVPTIAPSSGLDSDTPRSPSTPPAQHRHRDRGHENESYGYGSSSENPYTDQLQHTHQFASPGPPPGPPPNANKIFKPTNLEPSFNTAADLPPPLDEGPEAYSRDSVAFPTPPPPLSDGPEPYHRSTRNQQGRNSTRAMHSRPTQLDIQSTPSKHALSSSSSSPGSSSLSTEKSITAFSSTRTLENNLQSAYSNKNYQRPPFPVANETNQPIATQQQPDRTVASSPPPRPYHVRAQPTASSSPHSDALSNPIYNNNQLSDAHQAVTRPPVIERPAVHRPPNLQKSVYLPRQAGEVHRPPTDGYRPAVGLSQQSNEAPRPTDELPRQTNRVPQPANDVPRPVVVAERTTVPSPSPPVAAALWQSLALPTKLGYRDTQRHSPHGTPESPPESPPSPTAQLRHIRSRDSQPKDNTFKRMVTGNLSLSTAGPATSQLRPSMQHLAPQVQYKPYEQLHQQAQPAHLTHTHLPPTHLPPTHLPPTRPAHVDSRVQQYNRSQPFDTSQRNINGVPSGSANHVKQDSSPSVPPWQRNGPSEGSMRNTSYNPRMAAQPVSTSSNSMNGTLKEVTSSYGGLYSSRQSPAPSRRRGNYRLNNDQTHPSTNHEPYQSTNITDDVKTTSKGPFISAHPSVI